MSELDEVDSKIARNVDELVYEDTGFLKAYEDYSFSSAALVSNGNAATLQGATKVVSSSGLTPVQAHEMQEPMITKVIQAQTATGEGTQHRKKARNYHRESSVKQRLNWFHVAGSLATEREHKLELITQCYMPPRLRDDSLRASLMAPLHVSEGRLWPTGQVLAEQYLRFLQTKT